MNSLLGDGAGEKPYDLSGSYGVGHLAPMALSNIRYMLYGGVTKEGHRIACGRTVLASHPGKDQLRSALRIFDQTIQERLGWQPVRVS